MISTLTKRKVVTAKTAAVCDLSNVYTTHPRIQVEYFVCDSNGERMAPAVCIVLVFHNSVIYTISFTTLYSCVTVIGSYVHRNCNVQYLNRIGGNVLGSRGIPDQYPPVITVHLFLCLSNALPIKSAVRNFISIMRFSNVVNEYLIPILVNMHSHSSMCKP